MELFINYGNCEYRFVLLKCHSVSLERCFWWPQTKWWHGKGEVL